MINSIKFRMGSGLSIPIYSDWLKIKSLNIEENHLVISAVNGVPTDIAIAFEELPIGFIIFASQNIEFESVEQDLEHVYNAMEFDLYRRSMKIGFADLIQLHDLDNWRYLNGIPVELQLSMKVLEDDDGAIGLTISAKNDVANALMRQIKSVSGDDYSISVPDKVETRQAIANRANLGFDHGMTEHLPIHTVSQTLSDAENDNITLEGDVELSPAVGLLSNYKTGMRFENDVKLSRLVDLNNIDNGMIQVTGSDANLVSLARALQQINNSMGLSGSDEVDVSVGVSVLQDDSGEVCLVLRMPDDVETEFPCTDVTVESATDVYVHDAGEPINIQYTVTPSNTTDTVQITSSNTNIVNIVNGVPVSGNHVGDAQITITCGEQSASITVHSSRIMDPDDVIGFYVSGATTQGGGRYAHAASLTGYPCKYSGMSEPWGDGRYVSLLSREPNHIHPYKLPDNCNCISVTVPDTFAGQAGYRVLFFDSTRDGCYGDDPSSEYAYWLSTSPSSLDHDTSQTIIVDPDADSFVMSYTGDSYDYFEGCIVELLHVDS